MENNLVDVALGNLEADVVIKGGRLVNVITKEVYLSDVAISGKKIAALGDVEYSIGKNTKIIDAEGLYLVPGFIDAHIHFESSMLSYNEFSKMVLKRGTTAVATDLMELTIVSGVEATKTTLEESEKNPVSLLYVVPAFMSDSHLQTTGSILENKLIEELIDLPEAIGLAEVLSPPILAKSLDIMETLKLAKDRNKTAEGHAPITTGRELNAFVSAGIRSDHESTSKEEALEKVRLGLRVLLREGSASRDLVEGLKIITEEGIDSRHVSMVSDDIDALFISDNGHLDYKIRMAIKAGIDPITAIQMVTINPAESFKIDNEFGSISPGRYADIVLLSSLEECKIEKVVAKGDLVVVNNKITEDIKKIEYPKEYYNTVKYKNRLKETDFMTLVGSGEIARVKVMGVAKTSLIVEPLEADLKIIDNIIQKNIEEDILYVSTIERYGKNGGVGNGFVKGFGLKSGALATSVGHDHHNVTVVGSNFSDMLIAVNRIEQLNGGVVLVENGKILSEIELPLFGLLTDIDGEIIAEKQREMFKNLCSLGCDMPSPLVSLSFITLIFIPSYAITDKGLVDVEKMDVVDSVIKIY